jgi:hypothetical protein
MALSAAQLSYQRSWKAANREHVREQNRLWEKANPEKVLAKKRRYRADPNSGVSRNERSPQTRRRQLFLRIRKRAEREGIEFTLRYEDIVWPQTCPVFGFAIDYHPKGSRNHDSPSIDRLDSSRGYTPDNIIVMSWRANWLKRDASLSELRAVLGYIREQEATNVSR